jgi:lipoprotein-anchoring transpeptidase ErfK/SrfK
MRTMATVKVYFTRGEQLASVQRTVPSGGTPPRAALRELLEGPTAAERERGIRTTIPDGARILSVDVDSDGTATADFAFDPGHRATGRDVSLRPARAAQVIYTLTALPGVDSVTILLNGRKRASFIGRELTIKGPLAQRDFAKPVTLPRTPGLVPDGPAPAAPRAVQSRLATLGYLPRSAVNGRWDYRTQQAVMAFQAWSGIGRDGAVGPQTIAALERQEAPVPTGRRGRRIEVYRARGVALLVEDGRLRRAIHVSTGAPGTETPLGTYRVYRKERNSWSVPFRVWLPYASYFTGGIAFHGYDDVPPRPASHGCVRVPHPEAPGVYQFARMGTTVAVYR